MSYFNTIQIKQNVTADSNNSSTTNLSSSNNYSFTGSASSTLGVAGIQVSLKTDRDVTVYIEQSPDGNNWDISDVYNYHIRTNNFGVTVTAISSYVRVRVGIKGSIVQPTTVFRLQTALCPIVESLPRNLDSDGYLKTSVYADYDSVGFNSYNTPMGEGRVVSPTRLVGAVFDGNFLDPNFWTSSVSSSGTTTVTASSATLSTGTSANGLSFLSSIRRARYVSANSNIYRATVRLESESANNIRRWGVGYWTSVPTITDGAYFQLSGSTFSVNLLKTGTTAISITNGDFNGDYGNYFQPTANALSYEIMWTNSKVCFFVDGILLHSYTSPLATWSSTMHFYIFSDNINYNNSLTDIKLHCRVASIRRLGNLVTQPIYFYRSTQTTGSILKYGSGNLHSIAIGGDNQGGIVTLYDNTAASGQIIYKSGTIQATTNYTIDLKGVPFSTGLTLVISGANESVTVIYE